MDLKSSLSGAIFGDVMRVKKAGGKVYGADFTAAERKAMNIEINRQIIENDRKYAKDFDATLLYFLRVKYGFGHKRLKEFFMDFDKVHEELIEYYQMEEQDGPWLCNRKLQEYGIDLDEWYKEKEAMKNGSKNSGV